MFPWVLLDWFLNGFSKFVFSVLFLNVSVCLLNVHGSMQPVLSHEVSAAACASPGSVCSTAICSLPGDVWHRAASPVHVRICSKAACAVQGGVLPTSACASPGRFRSTAACAVPGIVWPTAALTKLRRVCLHDPFCCTCKCMSTRDVCCTWSPWSTWSGTVYKRFFNSYISFGCFNACSTYGFIKKTKN
jgi:hypothetical protein